jgi:hypothetical protein
MRLGVSPSVLALAWLGFGCEAAPEHPPATPTRARAGSSLAAGAQATPEPLPSEAECRECHPEVTAQWQRSRHRSAFQNPDFQRSLAREPLDFCRHCHAPGLVREPPLPAAEAEALGVGCLDCHAGRDTILTGRPTTDASVPAAPHALTAIDGFATQTCARCHEFEFPPTTRQTPGTMMQLTMREHRASGFADRSCASCHLPGGDHSLASSRDDDAIRRAVTITTRREGDDLLVELVPNAIGHAFPTGDLYRRVEIHAERQIDGRAIASATRYLDREWRPWRFRDARLNPAFHDPIVDDRVIGPTLVRLELDVSPEQPGGELVWWVDYERVDARDDIEPERSTVASEVRLAEGVEISLGPDHP